MTHGPTSIPSKGTCIYCGDASGPFGDEHIVPESLGGQHILKAASCRNCEAITTKFERKVARDLWGDARIAFGAPSKRKRRKSRKDHIAMADAADPNRTINVPAKSYPAAFVFYKMGAAGLLQGLPEHIDISLNWQLVAADDERRRQAFLIANPGRNLTLKFRHVPEAFGQLLAKIGYGQILTQLDLGDFRPICLPYITGEKANVSYIVGGSLEDYAPDPRYGYSLTTASFGSPSRLMLMAIIRLYANIHSPAYHVVVGDVTGAANVSRVLEKLGFADKGQDSPSAEVDTHWLPKVLPLPYWSNTASVVSPSR
jgi:hypothetical protein